MEWDKEDILDLSSDKWTHNGCILKQVAREAWTNNNRRTDERCLTGMPAPLLGEETNEVDRTSANTCVSPNPVGTDFDFLRHYFQMH